MCKSYTKTNSWFQKSHEEFGQLKPNSGKSKKLKFDGLLLSKHGELHGPKNTFLQLKQYIQRIYLPYLQLLVHQIPYVIFEAISNFS